MTSNAEPLFAALAYLNLGLARQIMASCDEYTPIAQQGEAGLLAANALQRYQQLAINYPGGFAALKPAMADFASPFDEWEAMTKPRNDAELALRVMAVASWQLELVARLADRLDDGTLEICQESAAGIWQIFETASQQVLIELAADGEQLDELSVYARRLLGEAGVLASRLVVRESDFRALLAGEEDEDLKRSGDFMDEVLAAVSMRLAGVGLHL